MRRWQLAWPPPPASRPALPGWGLLLRPERIELEAGTQPGQLNATVRDITFLGNNIHVMVEPSGIAPLSVRLPFGHRALTGLMPGQPVSLKFNPAMAHAFQ